MFNYLFTFRVLDKEICDRDVHICCVQSNSLAAAIKKFTEHYDIGSLVYAGTVPEGFFDILVESEISDIKGVITIA